MNKEAYVSFKVAKLLKEKGFDWDVFTFFDETSNKFNRANTVYNWNNANFDVNVFSAPTQQMACRWIWEEKGLNINAIYGDYPSQKRSFWMPQIDSLDGCYGVDDEDFFREYNSREDCIEAALEYALTKLI